MTTTTSHDEALARFAQYLSRRPAATADIYTRAVRQWFEWLEDRPATRETGQAWVGSLMEREPPLSNNTIATYCNGVRRFLRMETGSRVELEAPKIELGEPTYHEVASIERMILLGSRLEAAVVGGMFYSACRISEVFRLQRSDIDWEEGTIDVTRKGGARETVTISPRGLALIQIWLSHRKGGKAKEDVFLDYIKGATYAAKVATLRGKLKKLAKRAGVEEYFTPHHLRHSRAVQLLQHGMSIDRVSEKLGHKNVNTTAKVYTRLMPKDQHDVLEKILPEEYE